MPLHQSISKLHEKRVQSVLMEKLTVFECPHLHNEDVLERRPNSSRLLVVEAEQRVPELEHNLLALDLLQQPPLKSAKGWSTSSGRAVHHSCCEHICAVGTPSAAAVHRVTLPPHFDAFLRLH